MFWMWPQTQPGHRSRSVHVALLAATLWLAPAPSFADHPDINSVRLGEAALTFSSGFIRSSVLTEGVIGPLNADAQTTSNKMILGAGDLCYLQLTKGSTIEVGAPVTLYRRINEIFHPAKGKYLGDLFINVGIGEVTELTKGLATVRIVRSWGPIIAGDRAHRFVPLPPAEPPLPGRSLPTVPGYIVAFQPSFSLVAQSQVIFIDWGRNDGLRVGDRLDVLRTSANVPIQKIGELQVLAAEETTATALVVRSTVPFLRADRIVFQEPGEKVVRKSSAESIAEEMERLSKALPAEQQAAQPALGAPAATASAGADLSRLAALAKQLEFEPGAAPVKPTGMAALKEIAEILKTVPDKDIRIEGHTDRMPIGPSLRKQFANNVALSKARADEVVRYLTTEGGVAPANLTVVAHGDAQPVASNGTEEGRKQNRRIEIVLVPKELPPVLTNRPAVKPEPTAAEAAPQGSAPPAAIEEPLPASPPVGEPAPATQLDPSGLMTPSTAPQAP